MTEADELLRRALGFIPDLPTWHHKCCKANDDMPCDCGAISPRELRAKIDAYIARAAEHSGELLPCPFCGAEPIENRIYPDKHYLAQMPPGSWSVECVRCEVRVFDLHSRANVVAKWNRRAPADGVVVPMEPTEAMIVAGSMKVTTDIENGPACLYDVYKAMLSAAPSDRKGGG